MSKQDQSSVRRSVLFTALFVAIVITCILLSQSAFAPSSNLPSVGALMNGQRFTLERAQTEDQRERGLGGRTSLAPQTGMLFVFDQPGQPCFWMKDTLINLDMLWFDSSYRLVYMQQNVLPSSYPASFCPDKQAQYVVELPAGTAQAIDAKLGMLLTVK